MDTIDAAFAAGFGVPAAPHDGRKTRLYSAGTARRILRRTREGESLRAICRSPGMPRPGTVRRWMETRPLFGAAMAAARAEAGRCLTGQSSSYCRATAEAIFERLCAGEAMVAICADPAMPVASTVYRWLAREPEFREAVGLARQIQADRLAWAGWRIAEAAAPETAYLTDVRLKHLRWFATALWPRRYGPAKAVEAAPDACEDDGQGEGQEGGMTVVIKKFTLAPDGGPAIPTDEPAKVLYRLDGEGRRTEGDGEVWAPDADGRRFMGEGARCAPRPGRRGRSRRLAGGGSRRRSRRSRPGGGRGG